MGSRLAMTTLSAYFFKAQELAGEELLGRSVPVSLLTATTAVSSSQLAFGGNSEQKYAQKWMWRYDTTTTADKVRFSDSFAPGTGTLTHSGTNYSDTTATDEDMFILPEWLEPYRARTAVHLAVQQVREWDETIIPVVRGQEWHWLHELDWIKDSASIRDIFWNYCPVITRNRYLQKRHAVNSSGVLTLDYWEVTNNADTAPFDDTYYRNQKYVYELQRAAGTNATMKQFASALHTGVSGDPPAGETITAVVVALPATNTDVLLSVYDNDVSVSATATSSGTARQELTAAITLPTGAQYAGIEVAAQTTNATQHIYEAYMCIGTLTDQIRRDDFPRYMLHDYKFEQGGPLKIHNPHVGSPGQLIICSERPFPGFDATRLGTGAADADESDAPLVPVAVGTVAILLEQHLGKTHPESMAWRRKFESAILKHLAYPTEGGHGKKVLNPPFAASPMRVR
jgi:hypothetical protein